MIKLLQISDLHIVKDAEWNNLRALLLRTAKGEFENLPKGKKLLVVTGDFHFYDEVDYKKSLEFLKELVYTMKIEMKEDVFLIPGNHDVSVPKGKIESINQINLVKAVKGELALLQDKDYIQMLLKRFNKYSAFCVNLGVYSNSSVPATVHFRSWRNSLNIVHLNTCLVSDDEEKTNQVLDTNSLTELKIENDYPTIILGHNSFFDLHETIRTQAEAPFFRLNARAYLCGDRHKLERDRYQQFIRLNSGYGDRTSIPNIVCCRSSADVSDDYSDVGCIIHNWDEDTGKVSLDILEWEAENDQNKFVLRREENAYDMNKTMPLVVDQTIDSSVILSYQKYIRKHCGEIELNGLPTNNADVARRYELSKLFVPPKLYYTEKRSDEQKIGYARLDSDLFEWMFRRYVTIKEFIPENETFKYLVLAAPGAGKTMLLKTIASSYGLPEEDLSRSELTERELFPIWIRCRDIKTDDYTIWKAIRDIPSLCETIPDDGATTSFVEIVKHHIAKGTALLLIDGLDEIGSDRGRSLFVEQLKNFINQNPNINVIISSREKGFSIVSNSLFDDFMTYRISDLDNGEIKELCNNWFALVYGESKDSKKDLEDLKERIINNPRLRRLASNPLLLTTLLLVDRRTGSLPTKRAGLYFEATRVLLETWNSEWHEKGLIDLEEAKNQLAYVAFDMTAHYEKYKNRITRRELIKLLQDVRTYCSNLVSGNVGTIDNVISVVERRSALLVQSGLEEMDDGHMEPVYEFMHTTFQEYLAAYAVSVGCYPGVNDRTENSSILEDYLFESNMKEVILLTAAMDPGCAKNLAKMILNRLPMVKTGSEFENLSELVLSFVADEAPLSRDDIKDIFETCFDKVISGSQLKTLKRIVEGKYKQNLQECFTGIDEKKHDGYDHFSSLVPILSGEIKDPYLFFVDNCSSEDDKKRELAFSVLSSGIFVDRKLILNDDIKKQHVKKTALSAVKDENRYVAEQAFHVLRLGELIESIDDLSSYIDDVANYIIKWGIAPRTIALHEVEVEKSDWPISVNTRMGNNAVGLICNFLAEFPALSSRDYTENLTLLLAASVCCDESAPLSDVYMELYEQLSDEIRSSKAFKKGLDNLWKLIEGCPHSTRNAINEICKFKQLITGAKE